VEVSLDSFQFIKTLGKGGFGTVFLAKRKLPGGPGQLYAIKAVKNKRAARTSSISAILAEEEALILASGHPFITALHSYFQNNGCLHFLNLLHIFRPSLILKFTVSMKI
jgi:serine/threonine protein kinase